MELRSVPDNYTYFQDLTTDSDDKITFRIKEVSDESSAKIWIENYEKSSKTTWRILRTFPDSGKVNVFKLCLRCQHSTDKRRKSLRSSKNTNCPAELVITVRRYVRKSRSKASSEMDFIKEFPCVVTLKYFRHNHSLDSDDILKHRDLSTDYERKLLGLFRLGHSPSSALHLHRLDLMLEFQEDYYKIAADGYYIPSLSIVSKLYEKGFINESESFSDDKMFTNLNKLLQEYMETTSGKALLRRIADNYFVVLCTPVMLKAHEKIVQSGELVYLDTLEGVYKQRHRIYILVTPTAAGGLPIGVIITDGINETVLTEALQCFQHLLGENIFHGNRYPTVFLTNNDSEEINALSNVFPKSIRLFCQFHMLKAMWSWLCARKHCIKKEHRQELYFIFKKVLYSCNENVAEENFHKLIIYATVYHYENFVQHVGNLWKNKQAWVTFYRKQLPIRSNNNTNFVEIVFRILKDKLLEKVMAFNLIQMVDFILFRFESYMKQWLIDFSYARYTSSLIRIVLPHTVDIENLEIMLDPDQNLFTVKDNEETFTVDLVRGICSCDEGTPRKICKHTSAVLLSLENEVNASFNVTNDITRMEMLYVAEAEIPSTVWTMALDENPNECTSNDGALKLENCSAEDSDNNISSEAHEIYPNTNTTMTSLKEELNSLESIFTKIKSGLESNPAIYLPAVHKMITNASALSEPQFVSALHSFGTFRRHSLFRFDKQPRIRRRHKSQIGL